MIIEYILKWLRGQYGVQGDYMYQSMHITSVIVVFIILVILVIIARSKISDIKKRKLLKTIAIFQLSFEILWRIIYYFIVHEPLINLWPMYPCNLGGVLIPIICLLDSTYGKKMFYLFAFMGGIITFALPDGIFNNNVFVFPILKSILQHTGIVAIPLYEFVAGYFRPSIKSALPTTLGLLINIFNSGFLAHWIGLEGDFLSLELGLPFVIDGVPQIITTCVSAGIGLIILSILFNPKEFIKTIKKS